MATSLTRYLRLRVDSNLSASAKYNLERIDLLGSVFSTDTLDTVNVKSRGDISLLANNADVGGSGSGGTINLGQSGNPLSEVNIFTDALNLSSGAFGLNDSAVGGNKKLVLDYKSDINGPVDTAADRTLHLDLDGQDRNLVLGVDLSLTGSGAVQLSSPSGSTLTLPASGTLSTLAGSETLTNKTINAAVNSISGLTNASIDSSAGITYSKLNLTNGIVNTDVNTSAAIAYSKLNLSGGIVNTDIANAAAIAYSKLNLASGIINNDISPSASISYSKLNLSNSLLNSDISPSAAISRSKVAAGTANRVVINDGSGLLSETSNLATTLGGTGVSGSAVFPTTGTIVTRDAAETLTNKTISGSQNTLQNIAYSSLLLTNNITNSDIASNAAIPYSKLSLTNSLVDADINTNAAIQGTKISPNFGNQLIQTTDDIEFSEGGYTTTFGAATGGQTQNLLFRLPNSAGSPGYVLSTNGSGETTWVAQSGGGGGGSDFWQDAVATFASLPAGTNTGELRQTLDTTDIYRWSGASWTLHYDYSELSGATSANTPSTIVKRDGSGNFAAGTITATLNGNANNVTGVVAIANGGTGQSNQQAALNNLTNIGGATAGDVLTFSGGNAQFVALPAPTYAQINTALGLPANSFVASNGSSQVVGYGEWNLDAVTKFSNVQIGYQPNNLSQFPSVFNWNVNVDPLQNSANDGLNIHSFNANLDSAATGFNLGTGGDAAQLISGGFSYNGNGATYGRLRHLNQFSNLGNGTDPFTFKGFTASAQSINTYANTTIDGNISGYDFNLNVNAASLTTSNFQVSFLSDFSQIPVDLYNYQGVIIQPNIATIKNGGGFAGINMNPNITDLEGNAGFQGINIGGQITNQSTSNGYQGININPNIIHLTQNSTGMNIGVQTTDGTAEWTGLNVYTSSLNTSGTVRGIQVSVPDAINTRAIEANGHVNLNSGFDILSGQVQQYGHVIGGEIRVPNGTSVTGTDVLANNMAFTVNTGDATSDITLGLVGITPLGFVGQVIGAGDVFGAINFCLNGYNPVFDGSIDRINNFAALALPNSGTGTLNEAVLYYGDFPFGAPATDAWGLRIDTPLADNYVAKNLIIGTSTFKPSNASVGLELDATDRAVLLSRMDSTQESALTALNGMLLYNTTSNKFRAYENGAWTDVIGAGGGPASFVTDWTSGTTFTATHNLGTRDVRVEIYDNTTYETVMVDSVVRTDSNNVDLTASSAPSGAGLRILITEVV